MKSPRLTVAELRKLLADVQGDLPVYIYSLYEECADRPREVQVVPCALDSLPYTKDDWMTPDDKFAREETTEETPIICLIR